MASSITSLSISSPSAHQLCSSRSSSFAPTLPVKTKPQQVRRFRNANLSVRSDYRDGDKGGSSDFVAGFVLGGAVFGTLAYVFAPQIRRAVLNEDEYGFRRARRPIYYDEGLENTRQTLNAKIRQLNSAIDNVSSRLRGGNKTPPIPIEETDPEMEASK